METLTPNASRCKSVQDTMGALARDVLGNPEKFEPVKYGRWRSLTTGSPLQIETNYVYGEGTVRFYTGADNTPDRVFRVTGLMTDLSEVLEEIQTREAEFVRRVDKVLEIQRRRLGGFIQP